MDKQCKGTTDLGSSGWCGPVNAAKIDRIREQVDRSWPEDSEHVDLGAALEALGLSDSTEAREHLAVLRAALAIYADRSPGRGDTWRRAGVRGMVFNIYSKAERVWYRFMRKTGQHSSDTDDLIDLINYSAFAVRAIADASWDGDWPWGDINS